MLVEGSRSDVRVYVTECPLCFERYRDDESGGDVPRILQCGHSACHGCYAKMLVTVNAEPNARVKKHGARSAAW